MYTCTHHSIVYIRIVVSSSGKKRIYRAAASPVRPQQKRHARQWRIQTIRTVRLRQASAATKRRYWTDALRSRPQALGQTATTERGPPDHLKTCAQNAHMLRRRGLNLPSWQRRSPNPAIPERDHPTAECGFAQSVWAMNTASNWPELRSLACGGYGWASSFSISRSSSPASIPAPENSLTTSPARL
jgi:hypothetical protein